MTKHRQQATKATRPAGRRVAMATQRPAGLRYTNRVLDGTGSRWATRGSSVERVIAWVN